MSVRETYPNLFLLIAGGFNQDWPEMGGSLDGVAAFIRENYSEESIAAGLQELDQAVDAWRRLPDSQVDQNIFGGLGCEYIYTEEGATGIEFLERVRRALSE